jgi:hypothetical protein
MTEKSPNCEDIAYNCTQLVEKYHNSFKADSAKQVLNYWENKCGLSEPLLRIKILFSIKDNNFTEALYDTTVFEYIKKYKERIESTQPLEIYNYYKIYFGFVQINGTFDKFTRSLANELINLQSENSLEYLFCKLYSGNPNYLFNELQNNGNYEGTKLKEYYYSLVNKYVDLPEFHWSLYSGIWIPLSNAKILGNHPIIGIELGCRYKKFNYNLSMNIKFSRSQDEYLIVLEDSVRKTNYFFGGYIGLDVEREIVKSNSNEIDLLIGIGYDGFSTINNNTSDDNPNNDVGKSINSLNLNTGLGYRYKFKNHTYFGLRAKYNFVNYKNSGGSNLSGNTLTIILAFGGFSNYKKNINLEALYFKK